MVMTITTVKTYWARRYIDNVTVKASNIIVGQYCEGIDCEDRNGPVVVLTYEMIGRNEVCDDGHFCVAIGNS